MDNFYIEGEEFIPEVDFDAALNVLTISGASYHEYTDEFFEPVFIWLAEYLKVPGKKITINFRMQYFNTASSKAFYDILEMLEEYESEKGGQVTVNWYYQSNDIDMLESGKEFIESLNLVFNMIPFD